MPYVGINDARMHQLTELRNYLKERRPEMGLGIEWLSDVTAQHVDFVHIWGNIAETTLDKMENYTKPHSISFQEFYRYAFPQTIVSNREIRTDEDIERRVNTMLLKGCCSDVEIYRCQDTIAETPHYQEYLTQANAFRDKFKDILSYGKFLSDFHQKNIDNQEFSTSSWIKGNTRAVMLSQSHLEKASGILNIPGYKFVKYDSILGDAVIINDNILEINLPRHSLAIIIFNKN